MILLLSYKEQSSKCERQEGYKCYLIPKQIEHFSQSPPQFFFQNTKSTLVYFLACLTLVQTYNAFSLTSDLLAQQSLHKIYHNTDDSIATILKHNYTNIFNQFYIGSNKYTLFKIYSTIYTVTCSSYSDMMKVSQ